MPYSSWSYLEVYTNGSYGDSIQAYAAGLSEGYITKDLIEMAWHNTMDGYCTNTSTKPLSAFCMKLQKYLNDNMDWVTSNFFQEETSPYWHQVVVVCKQCFSEQTTNILTSAKKIWRFKF